MIESMVMNYLMGLIVAHPQAAAILAVIGFLQMTMRPFCDFVEKMIHDSETTRDDQWLVEVREKTWFKVGAYILKLIAGVKIAPVKEAEAPAPPSAL